MKSSNSDRPTPLGCGKTHPRGVGRLAFSNMSCSLGGKDILKDISGEIQPGKLTAILGANGCGKSTWLRALLGLVNLQSGTVSRLPDSKGYLPQKKEVYWPLTCEAIVNLSSTGHACPPWREPRATKSSDQILNRLSISYLRDKRIDEVSGGERTLVLLARVLRDKPAVIIADEPTAELDPKHQMRVMQILKEEALRGATVIVTMHDIQLTSKFADHIFLMKEGKILFQGNASSVLNPENLEAIFGIRFMEEKGFYAK